MADPAAPSVRAGVIGWPVGHSLSPRLHAWWLEQYGIDGSYEAMAVEPENLASFLASLKNSGLVGVNVTVPHKQAALAGLDTVTEQAGKIGAVNTIVVDKNGKLHGSNTDGFGFMENLRAGRQGFDATTGPAVVLGAGGAARAVVAVLLEAGAPEVRLLNRTRDKADAIANDLDGALRVLDWDGRDAALDGAALLVNTTSLGMVGQAALQLSLDALPEAALVNDIVYAPLETELLKAAAARGNPVVDGLGMLLHQARPAFEAFFGVAPEVTDDLRRHMLAVLQDKD